MAKEETPQPITRAEFEAGVKFYHSPKLKPFDDLDFFYKDIEISCISDKYDHFYCSIYIIEDDGFTFIHHLFSHAHEFKVLFKNCFKLPNQ